MKRANPPASRLDLTDLAALRDQLKHETEQREAERQRAEAAARQAEAEADLFRASIGEVSALRQGKRVEHPRTPPAPQPVHSRAEEQRVLRASLSDEFDVDNLLDTDDTLSYRRPGIGEDVLKKLRRGEWATQDQIDLHGLRRDEARRRWPPSCAAPCSAASAACAWSTARAWARPTRRPYSRARCARGWCRKRK